MKASKFIISNVIIVLLADFLSVSDLNDDDMSLEFSKHSSLRYI